MLIISVFTLVALNGCDVSASFHFVVVLFLYPFVFVRLSKVDLISVYLLTRERLIKKQHQ